MKERKLFGIVIVCFMGAFLDGELNIGFEMRRSIFKVLLIVLVKREKEDY